MDFVVGFAFDQYLDQLLLIRKRRPSWQAGRLNGIGGKIEPVALNVDVPESSLTAMRREFMEETGLLLDADDFKKFGVLRGFDDEKIYLFTAQTDAIHQATTVTDETVDLYSTHTVVTRGDILPNLRWLIPAARDFLANPNGFRFLTADYRPSQSVAAELNEYFKQTDWAFARRPHDPARRQDRLPRSTCRDR